MVTEVTAISTQHAEQNPEKHTFNEVRETTKTISFKYTAHQPAIRYQAKTEERGDVAWRITSK